MGILRRGKNKPQVQVRPESEIPSTPTNIPGSVVPLDQQDRSLILVPQLPIEVTRLLIAVGAEPGPSVIHSTTGQHYRIFRLRDDMDLVHGRYARVDEFSDGSNPVYAMLPGSVYAPDQTMLFSMYTLGESSISIGASWQSTAELLGTQPDVVLPEQLIKIDGAYERQHSMIEQLSNGITESGLLSVADRARQVFAKSVGLSITECDEAFSSHISHLSDALRNRGFVRKSMVADFLRPPAVSADVPTLS